MKSMNPSLLIGAKTRNVVLTGLCLVCASFSVHAAAPILDSTAAKARMETVREEVANVRSNIFLTLVELDRARRETNPESPKYNAFTNQVAVMEQVCKAFGSRAEEMKRNGDAWFADSAAKTSAIQDTAARQIAEQRYAERKASYESVIENMQLARKNFLAFYEHINGIKALMFGSQEASVRDAFMQANWRCIDTQRALMAMESQFDLLAASFNKDINGQ